MFEDALFWLGFAGLIGGIGVGISLLEEGDAFMRNVMFSGGIACVMFIYLGQLGEKTPASLFLFGFSFLIGGVAGILIAFAARGNLRAAFVAGGLAGVTLQVMLKVLPPGSWGFFGLHDIPEAIDILATISAGAGFYYLLRNWGKDMERWD
ncbi:MAG: hypothetical protein AB1649_07475 [Chloroflexota bacterium]